jgi:hypothetical protein
VSAGVPVGNALQIPDLFDPPALVWESSHALSQYRKLRRKQSIPTHKESPDRYLSGRALLA